MHIHILETGTPPVPLDAQFGRYPAMFRALLSPLDGSFSYSSSFISSGNTMPPVSSFDALLITSSPAGVYEGHDWIAPAQALIRETASAGKPQIGICFGHQLMAQAFGGCVEKSSRGWGVGVHRYDVKAACDWMVPVQSRIACAVSHQDQVIEPPKGAIVVAGSEFCPNGVLAYAQGPAISFQPHPEFSHDYADALMRLRRGRIEAVRVDDGLASLKGESDRALIGQWMATFVKTHAR